MLARCLGMALAALTLALCALAPATAWGGLDRDDEGASVIFSLQASNGYRLYVLGNARRDDGRGDVALYLADKGLRRVAYYEKRAYVTDTRLRADFGKLGRINLELARSGGKGRFRAGRGCNGTVETYDRGTFRGVLRFRGEEGFTSARASRLAVDPQPWVDLICSYQYEVETDDLEPGAPGATLNAEKAKRSGTTSFEATKNGPGGRTLVVVSIADRRDGLVTVRGVQLVFGPEAFAYDPLLSTATVDLPAPFSGTATFNRSGSLMWAGDLKVDLPGRADVPLVRPDIHSATLEPATWALEPPEFR